MEKERFSDAIEPIPIDLLREPIVWFFAEHYRHRDVCKRLLLMSDSVEFNADVYMAVRDFLEHDLPVHIIDEEDDLFPLLRRRCEPDDQIEKVLGVLSGEHASDMHDAAAVCELVGRAISEKRGLAVFSETADVVPPFCQSQQRHIAVENAVVLPIVRLRLTSDDLNSLGRRLAARRGLSNPYQDAS